jgi:response regulator RpfG family c-di-GMP phosphodiesterase
MKRSILSINGNKPFNYILKTVLSDKYAVLLAANPVSGLRLMKENKNLDLILIDTDVFQADAIDFILHVKTSSILDKPIIVLSSADMTLLQSRFSKIRIEEIFNKPFNPVILLQQIDKLLMPVDITFSIRP